MTQSNSLRGQLAKLESDIGYSFKDRTILEHALVHGSVDGQSENVQFAERLSWLGDAVLELVVSDYLVKEYPKAEKEWLHKARENLTRNRTLSRIGSMLRIEEAVTIGPSLRGNLEVRERNKMISGLVEGVVGAVYVDSGFRKTRKVVLRILKSEIAKL